jgi:tryptophanyl-tRNA synthetase
VRIDPWSSQQYADYARLREEFGIGPFDAAPLPDPIPLLQRGVVFGQRGFDRVQRAIQRREPWALLTGLMPSGPMHLGHKMVIDQILYYQGLGAEVFIAVADIEAYATRNMTMARTREVAVEHYVKNYLALGLRPERCQIYFQSKRQAVKDLAWQLGKKVNWAAMESIYGFTGSTNLGHVQAPLVQVGDILHVQLPQHGGPRPTLVPVGVDQDPHLRLTRDVADAFRVFSLQPQEKGLGVFLKPDARALQGLAERLAAEGKEGEPFARALAKPEAEQAGALATSFLKMARHQLKLAGFGEFQENFAYRALYLPAATLDDVPIVDAALAALEQGLGELGFQSPSSTYHRFMSGLTGGKMSSSKPETSVYLTEGPEVARKKVMNAKTGGRATAEEQRRLGGEWDKCMVAEMYLYHLAPEAADLQEKHDMCVSGQRLCGPCKGIAAERTVAFLKEHQERRAQVDDAALRQVVRDD